MGSHLATPSPAFHTRCVLGTVCGKPPQLHGWVRQLPSYPWAASAGPRAYAFTLVLRRCGRVPGGSCSEAAGHPPGAWHTRHGQCQKVCRIIALNIKLALPCIHTKSSPCCLACSACMRPPACCMHGVFPQEFELRSHDTTVPQCHAETPRGQSKAYPPGSASDRPHRPPSPSYLPVCACTRSPFFSWVD